MGLKEIKKIDFGREPCFPIFFEKFTKLPF